jgi:hypothetical protein
MIALSSKIDWPSNIVENIANGGIPRPSIPDVPFPKMQTSNYFAFGLHVQNVFLESEYVPASEYVSGIRREFPANASAHNAYALQQLRVLPNSQAEWTLRM